MSMYPKECFVPAVITNIHTYDPGELRKVELTIPSHIEHEGRLYPIRDSMRPGTAFLAKPLGIRTGKWRRRMYTRSNCSLTASGVLETIINDTHREKADTSPWWQSEQIDQLMVTGGGIDVRVDLHETSSEMVVFENVHESHPNNLRLESDQEWPQKRILALGFLTGITPFLSYVRYMRALDFGRTQDRAGVELFLIVSVRNPRQLMDHEELMEIAAQYPKNFRYHPVLTREWPEDWPYSKGRIIRSMEKEGKEEVDLSGLQAVAGDLKTYHVRMCGNVQARNQLELGVQQTGEQPLSFRAEVW